ncbi:MAG: Fic family protein [Gammaproteobacteria bacterium SHHR-1]
MATDKHWKIQPDVDRALMLAQRQISVFVYDAVNLEGIAFTLPEIQTLLDGITVGGHKLSDQQVAINQGNTWRFLIKEIKQGRFSLHMAFAKSLHSIAGKEDALNWGDFRNGNVTIAGTDYTPPDWTLLPGLYADLLQQIEQIDDIYDQAICVFLDMARQQYFFDVNKRMGRFMMNGLLLSNGYPAINLPARRQLEFNQLMLEFYSSGDMSPMNKFMRSCLDEATLKIMLEGQCSSPG